MLTHSFDLDMIPGIVRLERRLNQYDSDFQLAIHLVSRPGGFEIQSGTTAEIRGTKPDGNGYSAAATLDIEHAIVTVAGDEQITAVAGKCMFEITLFHGEDELNSANFYLIVERAALDKDTIVSDSVVRELIDVMDDIEEIVANANAASSNALKSEAYAVGQRNGIDVSSDDPAYHNNAKYYAEQMDALLNTLGLSVVDGAINVTFEE